MYEIRVTIYEKGTIEFSHFGDKRTLAAHGSDVIKLLETEVDNACIVAKEQEERSKNIFGRIMRWIVM